MLALFCVLLFLPILGAGCSSVLLSSGAPPTYYQIAYAPSEVKCSKTFGRALKIWDFSTSSPYDQSDMVVFEENRQVLYSSADQWVAKPGTMVSQSLIRDLNSEALFSQAVGPNSPLVAQLEMSGRVLVFGWQKRDDEYTAVFHVEVSVTEANGPGKILFKQSYQFESRPVEKNSPSEFARAMSRLVKDFSTNLRRDLCFQLTQPPTKESMSSDRYCSPAI